MSKIVFLDEYSIAGRDLSSITSQGEYVAYEFTRKEEVVERLKDADIAITNKVVIDGEAMRQLPKLKLICIAATGMNNVDLETAKELGIEVKNAVGYSTTSVAETTIASAPSRRPAPSIIAANRWDPPAPSSTRCSRRTASRSRPTSPAS